MVTMEDVRRAIDPDEPDYEGAAVLLGAEALPFLAELSRSEDVMIASKAVSLAGVIGGDEALPIIEQAVEAPAPEVRIFASKAAGRFGGEAEELLARLLTDGDSGVRKYAVRAVAEVPSRRLREMLEGMRVNDADLSVRARAGEALRRPQIPRLPER
jgi:HEAT repeat protein